MQIAVNRFMLRGIGEFNKRQVKRLFMSAMIYSKRRLPGFAAFAAAESPSRRSYLRQENVAAQCNAGAMRRFSEIARSTKWSRFHFEANETFRIPRKKDDCRIWPASALIQVLEHLVVRAVASDETGFFRQLADFFRSNVAAGAAQPAK